MPKLPRRMLKNRPKQGTLFHGVEPSEVESETGPQVIPLDFMTHAVRIVVINGDPWWVAADVCRVLEILDASRALDRLDDDEKGTTLSSTLGGTQKMLVINEFGLYTLIIRSDKPQAKPFRKWITSEVLPSIRKTGSYKLPVHRRVVKEQRRLKCDSGTAIARVEQFKYNRVENARLFSDGVNASAWHDAGYLGGFGKRARELREDTGLSKWGTPLDRMDAVLLTGNLHAKAAASHYIRERGESGRPISPEHQPKILETFARKLMRHDLDEVLPGHEVTVIDDPRRGKILTLAVPAPKLDAS